MSDSINHPSYYIECSNDGYEPIDVLENYKFNPGSAMGYLFRAGKKPGNSLEQDLQKARWYLRRTLTNDVDSGFVYPTFPLTQKFDIAFHKLIVENQKVNPLLKDLFFHQNQKIFHAFIAVKSIQRVIRKINEIVGDES